MNRDSFFTKDKKIIFLTFADDSRDFSRMKDAAIRLVSQCESSNLFAEVIRLDFESVKKLPNFGKIAPLFSLDLWGLGYFVWKPFIINWALDFFHENYDFVVYADAGCEFLSNKHSDKIFHKILDNLEEQSVLAYVTELPELLMTKKSVLDSLIDEKDKYRGNIEATVIYFKLDSAALDFSNTWLEMCINDNFNALMPVNNSKTGAPVLPLHCFDQSVFSVLYKNSFSLALTPVRPRISNNGFVRDFEHYLLSFNSIWPIRNRTGDSVLGKKGIFRSGSRIALYIYFLLRRVRRVKQFLDPRAKRNQFLRLLISYKEHGLLSRK
jgi:hypothetical protein